MNDQRLRLEWLDPKSLEGNPKNWRRHPAIQRQAVREARDRVGFAGALLYNERTNRLIDGHLRREEWIDLPEVPVLVGSWTEEEEAFVLATLDPIASLAETDALRVRELLAEIQGAGDATAYLLSEIAKGAPLTAPDSPQTAKSALPQAIQLRPAREYVVVMCADDDGAEFERLKSLLGLGPVRRGGYKDGSPFDAVGTQRVIQAADLIADLEHLERYRESAVQASEAAE